MIDIKEKAAGHAGDSETNGIYLNGKDKKTKHNESGAGSFPDVWAAQRGAEDPGVPSVTTTFPFSLPASPGSLHHLIWINEEVDLLLGHFATPHQLIRLPLHFSPHLGPLSFLPLFKSSFFCGSSTVSLFPLILSFFSVCVHTCAD